MLSFVIAFNFRKTFCFIVVLVQCILGRSDESIAIAVSATHICTADALSLFGYFLGYQWRDNVFLRIGDRNGAAEFEDHVDEMQAQDAVMGLDVDLSVRA